MRLEVRCSSPHSGRTPSRASRSWSAMAGSCSEAAAVPRQTRSAHSRRAKFRSVEARKVSQRPALH
jgi:hypothetical protein